MKNNQLDIELTLSRVYESQKTRKVIITILCVGFFVCLVFLLPPVQNAVVTLIQSHIHRPVSSFQGRLYSLLSLSVVGCMFCAVCLCALFSDKISDFLSAGKNTKRIVFSAALVYIAVLAFIFVFTYLRGHQWLNGDHSAEMVLGNLLAEENRFVSPNWAYSTELRLVYQTIFTMPLFKVLGALNKWALIRSLTIVLNILTLTASYIYLVKQLRVNIKWIAVTSIFLLLPISMEYWDIVLFGGYYVLFIAQIFCCLGLFFSILQSQSSLQSKSKTTIHLLLFAILSIVLGIQGIRALMSVQIPLLLACVYAHISGMSNHRKTPFFLGISGFILCGIGFFINNLLHFRYSFASFDDMRIDNLYDALLAKISESIYCLVQFFGFSSGAYILSADGILGILGLFIASIVFVAAWKSFGNKSNKTLENNFYFRFLALFFMSSMFFTVFLLALVNDTVTNRYFIPSLVIIFPLAAIMFEQAELIFTPLKRVMVLSSTLIFFAGFAFVNFQNLSRTDSNAGRAGYIQYLTDNNIKFGFAISDSQVTTELTNGKIDEVNIADTNNKLQISLMLNKKKYYDIPDYDGQAFFRLTHEEWKLAKEYGRKFTQNMPGYEDENYIILIYPSSELLYSEVLDIKNENH
jgi:hypothetical protein